MEATVGAMDLDGPIPEFPDLLEGNDPADEILSVLDSDSSGDEDDEISLESIDKSHTIKFPIRSNYSLSWGPTEAFRELVQNWRDAIIKSFNLPESDFRVVRGETSKKRNAEVIYKVARPGSNPPEWLGYIRWKGRDGFGTVEVVNRRATLMPSHLDMGGTTKTWDKRQAGAHGEGLKIALLVLQRGQQNHCVRCFSGSFKWNFNFTTQGRLVARLRRMTDRQLERARNDSNKQLHTPFAASPHRDVQFVVGQAATGRNETGFKTKRKQVSLDDFNRWCKAALFLQNVEDGGVLYSKQGDLIIGEKMRGNIYLKGLLLHETTEKNSASMTGKPLKFGYNFANGTTNRERQSMASLKEEARSIFDIWDMVLAVRPALVGELSAMLNSKDPEYADVSLAKEAIRPGTVDRLKAYLFDGDSKWYFSSKEKREAPVLDAILDGLDREGVEIQDSYWGILQTYGLVRTAQEEQTRRFQRAEPCPAPDTDFARQCDRVLRACVRGCQQTDGIQTQFIQAGKLRLNTLYSPDNRRLMVHQRWLNAESCNIELGLPKNTRETDTLLHAVRQLFSELLDQIPESDFLRGGNHTLSWLRKREKTRADQRVLEYTRILQTGACPTTAAKDLCVQHRIPSSPTEFIQQHRASTCSHLRGALISSDVLSMSKDCIGAGECPPANSTQTASRRCLGDEQGRSGSLEGGQEYFLVKFRPHQPNSIVVVTNTFKLTERATPASTAMAGNAATTNITGNAATSMPSRSNQDRSLNSEATDAAKRMPAAPASLPPRERFPSPSGSPPPPSPPTPSVNREANGTNPNEGQMNPLYALEKRIQSLNILEPRDWYESTRSAGGTVVIGVPKQEDDAKSGQKRRRV